MAYYTKESVANYINKLASKGYIALDAHLNMCANYSDEDFRGKVYVCTKNIDKMYWFEYLFHWDNCTQSKKDLCSHITKIQQEILDNWDAIVAGTYVSSVVLAEEKRKEAEKKKEIAEKKKEAREEKRIADCKTFNVDYCNPAADNYLDAITEIGLRLQDGEYSDLVLDGKIEIEFRTKNKRKDLPFTTEVCGMRTFTDDTKYGDLWEDIDDNLEMYILNTLVGATYNEEYYDFEQMYNNLEWLEMYADNMKKEHSDDDNVIKAADMLISSIKGYTEEDGLYKTKLSWENKKFIIQTLLSV